MYHRSCQYRFILLNICNVLEEELFVLNLKEVFYNLIIVIDISFFSKYPLK